MLALYKALYLDATWLADVYGTLSYNERLTDCEVKVFRDQHLDPVTPVYCNVSISPGAGYRGENKAPFSCTTRLAHYHCIDRDWNSGPQELARSSVEPASIHISP